jgi:putative addiction module component (TIGR02574 family)
MDAIDIASLSPEQRLELLEQIWDSLASTPDAVPVTSAQGEELSRRLDELDHEGPLGIPWDEVLRRIRRQSQ